MDTPLYILLVEDEPAYAEAIRRAFQAADPGAEVRVASTLREYRELVAARPPHIAIMDLNLPDGRAVDVLTSPPEAGPFPVVVTTSCGNELTAVEAMKAGALDYVVKPIFDSGGLHLFCLQGVTSSGLGFGTTLLYFL